MAAAPGEEGPAREEDEGEAKVVGEAVVTKEDFFKTFKAQEQVLKEELAAVMDAGGEIEAAEAQIHEVLDAVLAKVQALEASFTRSAHILPAYDVQTYRAALKAISGGIAAKRELLAPRKKFSFKNRKAPAVAATPEEPTLSSAAGGSSAAVASSFVGDVFNGERFEELRGVTVFRGPGELKGRDVQLRDLEGCRIVLLDMIGALHVRNLRRCEVIVGAVSSSALMHHCHECVFTLAAKQLRLHDSDQVALHLHTLSGPVIEHCKRIVFAPFDISWPEREGQLKSSGLGTINMTGGPWTEVQDFNWLKRQASPNWRQVPEELRRPGLGAPELRTSAGAAPPKLPELERYKSCWDTGKLPTEAFTPQPAALKAAAAPVEDAHDDEF